MTKSSSVCDDEGSQSTTRALSVWIEKLSLRDIPEDVKTRVKYLILDGLGCALVGARLPWSDKATESITRIEGPGNCTIFGHNQRVGPLPAALLNSTFIQGFEMDDYHSEAPIHGSAIVLPSLFAAAEQQSTCVDGASFLLAATIGYETGPRVGLALGGARILNLGWHSGAIFGPAAAAGAVSKLLNLPAERIEEALGIACTQAGGLISAQYGSEVKRMQHGFAVRNGLLSALLSRDGYKGIKGIFDLEYGGFLSTFSLGYEDKPRFNPEVICEELGSRWEIENVRAKPYCLMAASHATVDCIRQLQAKHAERMQQLSRISLIEVEMASTAWKRAGWVPVRPLEVTGAQMNAAYAVALQLVDGGILPSNFTTAMLNRDELWRVIEKVVCRPAEEFHLRWAQRVMVTFEDGQVLTEVVDSPRGVDPPLSNDEIVRKWSTATEGIIDHRTRYKIQETVLNLETVADVVAELKEVLGTELPGILME